MDFALKEQLLNASFPLGHYWNFWIFPQIRFDIPQNQAILGIRHPMRRDGWVAESTGLLNLRGGNLSEGSNPSLSAILFSPSDFWQKENLLFKSAKSRWRKGICANCRGVFETHSESEKRSFSEENHDSGVWILSFAEKVKNSVKAASCWLWTIFDFCGVTGMGGGIALGRNEKTPSFFWPGFEFKNYNWHPVLTGGQKTFLYQDFFRTLSLIWKNVASSASKIVLF